MIKNTIDSLPEKDRIALADLYDSAPYKVLKKLLEVQRLEIAKSCLDTAPETLKYLQGQAHGLKQLNLSMQDNFKKNQDKL